VGLQEVIDGSNCALVVVFQFELSFGVQLLGELEIS
jgi:hypothetical protein